MSEKLEANHLLTVPADYPVLMVPVPPLLEEYLGYESHRLNWKADFVSFFWVGRNVCWSDGRVSTDGGNWLSMLTYLNHPKVKPYLVDPGANQAARRFLGAERNRTLDAQETDRTGVYYNFGSLEVPNEYRLILDRRQHKLYAVLESDAVRLLEAQWTPDGYSPLPPTKKELLEAVRLFVEMLKLQPENDPASESKRSNAQMHSHAAAQRLQAHKLRGWLDNVC